MQTTEDTVMLGLQSSEAADMRDMARMADPFARIFRVAQMLALLAGLLALVVLLQGYWLHLSRAHVYEVHPDGKATYIGDRESNMAPRPSEAVHVAKTFVGLLYAWNSSTADRDIAAAVTMCGPAMGKQLREEIAGAQFVSQIRDSQIRSEITFKTAQVLDQTRNFARVAIEAVVARYGLAQYEGSAQDTRVISVEVIMGVVPRDSDLRLNGLEITRLVQSDKLAAPKEHR